MTTHVLGWGERAQRGHEPAAVVFGRIRLDGEAEKRLLFDAAGRDLDREAGEKLGLQPLGVRERHGKREHLGSLKLGSGYRVAAEVGEHSPGSPLRESRAALSHSCASARAKRNDEPFGAHSHLCAFPA